MIRTVLVHSLEGIAFQVQTSGNGEEQLQAAMRAERSFAATQTAEQLDTHGDYFRMAWGNV